MENYFDTAPCCYFSFSDNGEIIHVNQTLCITLGYQKEELIAQKIAMLFPVSTNIFYQTHFFPLLKMQGHAAEIFIFLKSKGGEQLPVLMNAKREEMGDSVFNNCVCIIVQNRKKFEDDLVNAKKIAEAALSENSALKRVTAELAKQAEELDEKVQLINKQNNELKQFSHVATHELQEPLRKVLIFASMLKQQSRDDHKQGGVLERFLRVVNGMKETINGLQKYVWLSETNIHPEKIDLNLLVHTVKAELVKEFKEDLLDLKSENLPLVNADRSQIHLLVYQLLTNALQYRKPGERASISITSTILKKNIFKTIEDRYKYEDFLKITVSDKGIGFESQYKDQIFGLFKKLHHLDRRGLGLSFCRLIAENHKGSIEAESNDLEGTSFSILFPGEILCNKL